mmetsp:Transcript_53300/g.125227  ORF Transcript_53300/g.125227 Transcript_53300/m.125227 type:complete len:254 (-) Transcript_53300:901-1662(-)
MACGRHVESVDVRAHAVHGIDPRAIRAFLRQREVEEELAHLPRRPDIAQVLREPVVGPCLPLMAEVLVQRERRVARLAGRHALRRHVLPVPHDTGIGRVHIDVLVVRRHHPAAGFSLPVRRIGARHVGRHHQQRVGLREIARARTRPVDGHLLPCSPLCPSGHRRSRGGRRRRRRGPSRRHRLAACSSLGSRLGTWAEAVHELAQRLRVALGIRHCDASRQSECQQAEHGQRLRAEVHLAIHDLSCISFGGCV